MVDKTDWRLTFQERYLGNEEVKKMEFTQEYAKTDHEHCCFCVTKFSEYPKDLHHGYVTKGGAVWICPKCFDDFNEMFNLTIVAEDDRVVSNK